MTMPRIPRLNLFKPPENKERTYTLEKLFDKGHLVIRTNTNPKAATPDNSPRRKPF